MHTKIQRICRYIIRALPEASLFSIDDVLYNKDLDAEKKKNWNEDKINNNQIIIIERLHQRHSNLLLII